MSKPDEVEGRRWDDLNPEILALIFVRIQPVNEMVRCVPFVCKHWMEVVAGPYCWQDINLFPWSDRVFKYGSESVDMVVQKLVRRSSCTFQRLRVNQIGESGFLSVVDCGRCLKRLQIPVSNITDDIILKHIKPLPNLKYLDISYCHEITSKGLAAFGNNCKSLAFLRKNRIYSPGDIDDSEAKTIAHTMPSLQHIELGFGLFGNSGLSEILAKCKSLTHLDIGGCYNVELDGDLIEICGRLVQFSSRS